MRLTCVLLALIAASCTSREEKEWQRFLVAAQAELKAKNEILARDVGVAFKPGWKGSWFLDMKAGKLVFREAKKDVLVARVQLVGTYHRGKQEWIWSWANEDTTPKLKDLVMRVRAFGLQRRWPALAEPVAQGPESLPDRMTAATVRVLGARGGWWGKLDDQVEMWFAILDTAAPKPNHK